MSNFIVNLFALFLHSVSDKEIKMILENPNCIKQPMFSRRIRKLIHDEKNHLF